MQTIGPATARHGTVGVLIDDDDFVLLDDVVDVAFKQGMGAQAGVDVVQQADVGGREQESSSASSPSFLSSSSTKIWPFSVSNAWRFFSSTV